MKKRDAYDVVVLGAGAAGLMCAIEAGKRNRRVLVIEHNDAVGKKIRISGGGRCNFTNLQTEPTRFISANPRFCHSALARYTPQDFISLVEKHRIAYHEKKLGQLFCDASAQSIIDALLDECRAVHVEIRLGTRVVELSRADAFVVRTTSSEIETKTVVIATGGLSIPKIGATDFGYRIARQFNVPLVETAPALVPFTLGPDDMRMLHGLSGIAFDAEARFAKTSFRENVLITHRGLSGPAILQISSYWRPGQPVSIDALPQRDAAAELKAIKAAAPSTTVRHYLSSKLPNRLADRLCERMNWDTPLGRCPDATLVSIAQACRDWCVIPAGTEGYAKAEVTRGGVDTRALSPSTMEVRHVPGLFFIGEVVDVTGWLGGYNFQWAWSSGYCAGQAM